ncbi:hypothetical protein H5J22_05785 [Cetobacterium sp. 8H]|uniref:hypothetical protein n=1 Tax=Cetobacterium sp. 8H TaxID=2759681 RepID=UPI00163B6FC8|nr:hypothetical protein [Cetobacterium sp. 8H]MBC2850948.1 hypothetical protein [Cetobacterium sp. 8H]
MDLTVSIAKNVLADVISKTKKSIEREDTFLKELMDDQATLAHIGRLELESEPLPVGCPYASYDEWRDQIEKEIKSSDNSINRISVEKAELMAFEYFVETAPEE